MSETEPQVEKPCTEEPSQETLCYINNITGEHDQTEKGQRPVSPQSTIDTSRHIPSRGRSMGSGRNLYPPIPNRSEYLVDFDGPNDPIHPFNWSRSTKLITAALSCFGTFQASLNSAIFAPASDSASSAFGVGDEVGVLGTTLFVCGFASGPLFWAPASEAFGRYYPLVIGMFGAAIFTIASAVAKDIQTLILCRFFSGLFGASHLSVVPAVLADIYNNTSRGRAIAVYSLAVFIGPYAAPFMGAFISTSFLGWRWTLYIPAFLAFFITALMVLLLHETQPALILVDKAAKIRRETGNWAIHAAHEEQELDFVAMGRKYFVLPIKMLVTEPVILLVTLYMSFVYGLVYALVEAIPYIFATTYNMRPGPAALPCIALIIGVVTAVSLILFQDHSWGKKLIANNGVVIPEWRLPPTFLGGPCFTAGIFWLSWTGFTSSIHWIVPTLAVALVGFGVLCIFLPCFNYIVDSYLPVAASAVAANIILRSGVAAGFPLFTKQMYENLGIQWAGTLLGCLAAIMIPIPLVFYKMGPYIRKRSRLAHG